MRPKYVIYGNGDGPYMFVIVANKTALGHWKVEISPCDTTGAAVSDPVEWDICAGWIDAWIYRRKLYKKYH